MRVFRPTIETFLKTISDTVIHDNYTTTHHSTKKNAKLLINYKPLTSMLSDKIKKHKTLIFLTLFSIWFAFNSSKNWLQDGCIITASDFECHRTIGHFIQMQLLNYHTLYPVSFESIHGAYAFVYSYIPYLIPLILTPILSYKTSFIMTYILFYALAPVAMYILLKNTTKNDFVSLLIPLYFLISPALNTQYTVYGSYHTILCIPFLLLGINSLIQYEKTKSKRNAIHFTIFSFMVGAIHIFTYMIYFIFTSCYSIIKKEKKLQILLLLTSTALAYYFIPVLGQQLISTSNEPLLKSGNMAENYNSLFFKKYTSYTQDMDYNYRPYLLIGAIISILISCIRKEENGSYKLSYRQLKSKIPPLMIIFSLIMLILIAIHGYNSYTTRLPLERYGLFAQISFMLIIGVALSKTRINLPLYLILSSILILLSTDKTRIATALIIPAIYLTLSYTIPKFDKNTRKNIDIHKIKIKDTLIATTLIILLFYPLTGLVFSSNTSPRFWCSTIPHISEIVTEKDIYHDKMESYSSISTLTKAKRSGAVGSIAYHTKANLALNDNHTYELLKKEETTKIIIAIYSNDWQQKYAHLFRWFGEPTVIQGTRRNQPQYYVVFNTGFTNERDYDMKIITPTTLEITKNPQIDEQFIHLSYHPWWKTDNKQATLAKDPDGFTIIKNAHGISKLRITWDYTYFYLGWLITILSVIALIYLIKKHPKDTTTPTTTIENTGQRHQKNRKHKTKKRK